MHFYNKWKTLALWQSTHFASRQPPVQSSAFRAKYRVSNILLPKISGQNPGVHQSLWCPGSLWCHRGIMEWWEVEAIKEQHKWKKRHTCKELSSGALMPCRNSRDGCSWLKWVLKHILRNQTFLLIYCCLLWDMFLYLQPQLCACNYQLSLLKPGYPNCERILTEYLAIPLVSIGNARLDGPMVWLSTMQLSL